MIKVLHITPSIDYGGISSVIMNYYHAMQDNDIQFDVLGILSQNAPRANELETLGGHYYFIGPFSNFHLFHNMIQWVRFFKQHQYDIVHAHCNLVSAWLLLAARMAGVKVRVAHSHSAGLLWGGRLQYLYVLIRRYIIKHSATLCLSCGQEAGMAMYGKHIPFQILPNGINPAKYQVNNAAKQQLLQELHIDESNTIYSMVARISTVKNHPFAIDVFREIRSLNPNSILIIGGPSSATDPTESDCQTELILHQKIETYHLEDAIRIVGERWDMPTLYAITDCWLFPSLYEGFPMGILELQAAGTPTLVSDTVTKATDMGLDLLTFLSINDKPEIWAKAAVNKRHKDIPVSIIKHAFSNHNLDITANAESLYQLYCSLL